MKARCAAGFRPSQLIDDMFRVCRVAERVRATGNPYFVLTLANDSGRCEALTGWPAAGVAPGDAVRVRGCVLRRGDRLVLVVCLLRRVGRRTHCTGPDSNEEDMSAVTIL